MAPHVERVQQLRSNRQQNRTQATASVPEQSPPRPKQGKASAHPKVEVVSCFRSSGSVPIPRPVSSCFAGEFVLHEQPKPRHVPEPQTHLVQEAYIQIKEQQVFPFTVDEDFSPKRPLLTPECLEDPSATVVSQQPRVQECPPSKPPQGSSCRKHSRCHCNLMSMNVQDFYSVAPSPPPTAC